MNYLSFRKGGGTENMCMDLIYVPHFYHKPKSGKLR